MKKKIIIYLFDLPKKFNSFIHYTRYFIVGNQKDNLYTFCTENFKAIRWKIFFGDFFFCKVMMVICASKKIKVSLVYIYELDLGLDLDRASKGVVISLELDIEVDLIHSTLLRFRFRSTSSVILFLLDLDSRSRSNNITFRRFRTRFRTHYCFH